MNVYFYGSNMELYFSIFIVIIVIGFILIGKSSEKPFFGGVILGLLIFLMHSQHTQYDAKEYLLKRFQEGKAIECGFLRGDGTLVDPNKGWSFKKGIGFVKDDMIKTDPNLCRVIGEEPPIPSSIPYWFSYLVILIVLFLLRPKTLKFCYALDQKIEQMRLEDNDRKKLLENDHE